ncbi:hypothetical protein CUU66_08315 [Peribacillus deserti]|uniref:Uncharacterized protein n=1 Tax=Peribacillus deserti TaxID=673318 RepID=A0A2N5M7J0_9BACI|nr:hypothetical protein CUU66_08315 [Peribacillus deserti]
MNGWHVKLCASNYLQKAGVPFRMLRNRRLKALVKRLFSQKTLLFLNKGVDWNVRMLADLRGGRPSLLGFACGVSPDRKAEDGAFQEKIHPKAE